MCIRDRDTEVAVKLVDYYYKKYLGTPVDAINHALIRIRGSYAPVSYTHLIYSYECGCDELKKLYEIMRNTDGIYGGRFSGAGFKGCCMALVDPEKVEDIKVKVTEEYLKAFPELEGRYSAYVCESADGVRL